MTTSALPTPAPAPAPAPPTTTMTVDHLDGERYAIDIRGHQVIVDQPRDAGGADTAPTPTELFAASLASCVAFYAGRYLDRHAIPRTGLQATASFTMATDRPPRVTGIAITVTAPNLPPDREAALLAVVSKCTVHNSLHQAPEVTINVG